ncbi:MAG: hypothetical protein RBR63_00200 [Methanosarcina vacuolata]|jgi:hypothetical protein|nr:hypothetical protein [Methanosarcina vacuolata]
MVKVAKESQDKGERVTGEAQNVKSTINAFLELIREIFDSDACYLYLINTDMDEYERKDNLRDRVNDIKKAYFKKENEKTDNEKTDNEKTDNEKTDNEKIENDIKQLEKCSIDDVSILKFINVVERPGEKRWNYNYSNRPRKYVIFKNFNPNEEIFNEGITAYVARSQTTVICNNKKQIDDHDSSANLNSIAHIKPMSEMTIGFPLKETIDDEGELKGKTIGVLTVENYSIDKNYNYDKESDEVKKTKRYLPLLYQLIESSACYFVKNSYSELFKGMSLLDNLNSIRYTITIDLLDQLILSLNEYESLKKYLKDKTFESKSSSRDEVKKKRLDLIKKRFIVISILDHLKTNESDVFNDLDNSSLPDENNSLYENLTNIENELVENKKDLNFQKYECLKIVTPSYYEKLKKDQDADVNNKKLCCGNLLEYLERYKCPEQINSEIFRNTLHLFLVLKRNEYIGYEEILNRISGYANDISELLDLTEGMTGSFKKYLDEVKKHEELLLYGLNDYRDHFMHQFHVFISGYIIINKLGIEPFRLLIKESLENILGKKTFVPDKSDVLRIWFLTAFYHDYAYILEKIDIELGNFFKDVFGYRFTVKFSWENLLTKGNEFPEYLNYMVKFFANKSKSTNQSTLLRNYLDSIIKRHDHGVLGALLLIHYNYNSKVTENRFNECLYAAFAISLHNKRVYENLTESLTSDKRGISFESFPIAFLLAYCDTAQSFGRLEGRDHIDSYKYPVRFSGIEVAENKISYTLEYIGEELQKIPRSDMLDKWTNKIDNVFYSKDYLFEITYYKKSATTREIIYNLSFR